MEGILIITTATHCFSVSVLTLSPPKLHLEDGNRCVSDMERHYTSENAGDSTWESHLPLELRSQNIEGLTTLLRRHLSVLIWIKGRKAVVG